MHSVTLCGRPSVVVGFSNEHMAYGQHLYRLGAGSKPVRYRRVTAGTLTKRIRHTPESPPMLKRASELGNLMRKEDGVACAVDAIEKLDIRCVMHSYCIFYFTEITLRVILPSSVSISSFAGLAGSKTVSPSTRKT